VIAIEVCVGSSCFLRGAEAVVRILQELVERHAVKAEVTLRGSFCMESCTQGVTIRVGSRLHRGVFPEQVPALFAREVLAELAGEGGEGTR